MPAGRAWRVTLKDGRVFMQYSSAGRKHALVSATRRALAMGGSIAELKYIPGA